MASDYIKIPSLAFELIDDTVEVLNKTWSSSKIGTELDALGEIYVRSTRFESIGAGTSGSLTLTGTQTIILDDFGGTTDAIVSTIEGGRSTNIAAEDSSGNVIAATLDGSGNWTLTATPDVYPVALIYRVREQFQEYDDTDSAVMGGLDVVVDSFASPGFNFGRAANVGNNTWLNVVGSVPSNKAGITVSLLSPEITNIYVANEDINTFDVTVYEHEGDEVNLTSLGTVSVVAARSASFNVSLAVTSGRQLAVRVTSGSAKNLNVGLQIKGSI